MSIDKIIMNPPYKIGGKITSLLKFNNPYSDIVVLMPLGQYKSAKVGPKKIPLYKYIDDNKIQFVGGDAFEDAVITKNNCIVTLRKDSEEKDYLKYQLKSCDQKFLPFYQWNIEHNKNIIFKPSSYSKIEDHNIDLNFVETLRAASSSSGAGFGKGGFGYKYNVEKSGFEDCWGSNQSTIEFSSKNAKNNFCKYWYADKKGKSLSSKSILGVNASAVSSEYFYAIPQIDWSTIGQNQKELWDKGLYDEAVLKEMGLKWNDDKTGVEYLR